MVAGVATAEGKGNGDAAAAAGAAGVISAGEGWVGGKDIAAGPPAAVGVKGVVAAAPGASVVTACTVLERPIAKPATASPDGVGVTGSGVAGVGVKEDAAKTKPPGVAPPSPPLVPLPPGIALVTVEKISKRNQTPPGHSLIRVYACG